MRSDSRIERIARRAGYASVEAFTRAFGADHGHPPAAYRSRLTPFHPRTERRYPHATRHHQDLPRRPPGGASNIAAITRRSASASTRSRPGPSATDLLDRPRRWFGIYYDDPASVPKAELRSEAALEIDADTPLDEARQGAGVPGDARSASVIHKGPYAELERTYRSLYGEWLPASGEEAADQPCFEHYINDARTTPPSELLTEVLLPLKD